MMKDGEYRACIQAVNSVIKQDGMWSDKKFSAYVNGCRMTLVKELINSGILSDELIVSLSEELHNGRYIVVGQHNN